MSITSYGPFIAAQPYGLNVQETTGPTGLSWTVPLTPAGYRPELPTVGLLIPWQPLAFTEHSPKRTSLRGEPLGLFARPYGVSSQSLCQGLTPIANYCRNSNGSTGSGHTLTIHAPRGPFISAHASLYLRPLSGTPDNMVALSSATTTDPVPPSFDPLTPMEICDRENSPPFLGGSLLQLPGRPLTPMPPSDSSTPRSPYHRRFPTVLASPPDLSRESCPLIGIWPSAAYRKRSSTEWYETLLDPIPAASYHGYQPLNSTGGPFSVLTALLAT